MSPEKQRIAIAQILGAKLFNNPTNEGPSELWAFSAPSPSEVYLKSFYSDTSDMLLPNYTASLDAMHEAEEVLTWKQHLSFRKHLWDLVIKLGPEDTWDRQFISPTAAQRCEAFLKTFNRWES